MVFSQHRSVITLHHKISGNFYFIKFLVFEKYKYFITFVK